MVETLTYLCVRPRVWYIAPQTKQTETRQNLHKSSGVWVLWFRPVPNGISTLFSLKIFFILWEVNIYIYIYYHILPYLPTLLRSSSQFSQLHVLSLSLRTRQSIQSPKQKQEESYQKSLICVGGLLLSLGPALEGSCYTQCYASENWLPFPSKDQLQTASCLGVFGSCEETP